MAERSCPSTRCWTNHKSQVFRQHHRTVSFETSETAGRAATAGPAMTALSTLTQAALQLASAEQQLQTLQTPRAQRSPAGHTHASAGLRGLQLRATRRSARTVCRRAGCHTNWARFCTMHQHPSSSGLHAGEMKIQRRTHAPFRIASGTPRVPHSKQRAVWLRWRRQRRRGRRCRARPC